MASDRVSFFVFDEKKRRRKNTYKNNQNWIITVFFLVIMQNDSDNDNSLENILIKLNKKNRIKEEQKAKGNIIL